VKPEYVFLTTSLHCATFSLSDMSDSYTRAQLYIPKDPVYDTGRAHVVLRPVNLIRLDQLITGERNVGAGLAPARFNGLASARSFAKWLAFGED
jgi:hypothetical protein